MRLFTCQWQNDWLYNAQMCKIYIFLFPQVVQKHKLGEVGNEDRFGILIILGIIP
jgi:hypothetical protein